MFEGVPTYPDVDNRESTNSINVDRFWDIVERHKVTHYFRLFQSRMGIYTAPTAIRALMRYGEEPVKKHDLSSIKVLGTVGEPINPESWLWYYKIVGKSKAPIVDTYWQKMFTSRVHLPAETGGFIMTPIATATPTKPGSCCLPFLGIKPIIFDLEGDVVTEPEEGGYFAMAQIHLLLANAVYPWPGMLRDVWGDTERFKSTYLDKYPGYYTELTHFESRMTTPVMVREETLMVIIGS
jgi:acetyl-CoA synthetase